MQPDVCSIPAKAGMGLRPPHYQEAVETHLGVAWLEVHSENFFGRGSETYLQALAQDYPLSLHGVGMGIGSVAPLDTAHLARLAELVELVQPALVSEHLCFNRVGTEVVNDLLPLPYTQEAVQHICDRVQQVQEALKRPILLENVSSYIHAPHAEMDEIEFLNTIAASAGCGLLFDVNNCYVNSVNFGFDATEALARVDWSHVAEIHVAGHAEAHDEKGRYLVDTHDQLVCDAVWQLLQKALMFSGPLPVLVEWDSQLPSLDVLIAETRKAEAYLANVHSH